MEHTCPSSIQNNCTSSDITVCYYCFCLVKTFFINHADYSCLSDPKWQVCCVFFVMFLLACLNRINLLQASTDTAAPSHCTQVLFINRGDRRKTWAQEHLLTTNMTVPWSAYYWTKPLSWLLSTKPPTPLRCLPEQRARTTSRGRVW